MKINEKLITKYYCMFQAYQLHILLFLRLKVLQNLEKYLQIFHSDTSSSATDRVTNMLLQEMDGLSSGNDVIVLGATNQPHVIDDVTLLYMLNIYFWFYFSFTNLLSLTSQYSLPNLSSISLFNFSLSSN